MQSTSVEPDYRAGVYVIRLSDRHFYGGRTVNFQRRWAAHLRSLRSGTHGNRYMQAVFNKHGRFEPEVIVVEDDAARRIAAEQVWLDANFRKLGCLNLAASASGEQEGRRPALPEETRAKISAALRGRKHDRERIVKSANSRRGRTVSDEARARMSAAQKGRKPSPETLQRMKTAAATRKKRVFVPSPKKGRSLPSAVRERMAEGQKRRRDRDGACNKGRVWVSHPTEGSRLVDLSVATDLLSGGWVRGRRPAGILRQEVP